MCTTTLMIAAPLGSRGCGPEGRDDSARSSLRRTLVAPGEVETTLTLDTGTPAAAATLARNAVCTPLTLLVKSLMETLESEKVTVMVLT